MSFLKDLKQDEEIMIDDLLKFAWEICVGRGSIDDVGLIIQAVRLIRAKEWKTVVEK